MNVPGSSRIIAVLGFSLILVLFLLFGTLAHGPSDDADLYIFMPEVFRRLTALPEPTKTDTPVPTATKEDWKAPIQIHTPLIAGRTVVTGTAQYCGPITLRDVQEPDRYNLGQNVPGHPDDPPGVCRPGAGPFRFDLPGGKPLVAGHVIVVEGYGSVDYAIVQPLLDAEPTPTPIGPIPTITPMPGGPARLPPPTPLPPSPTPGGPTTPTRPPPPSPTPVAITRPLTESLFLPMVKNNYVPPLSPVLEAISNTDGDGYYTVAWSIAIGAAEYVLQEDDSASFSSPTDVYSGPSKSKRISHRGIGTYYYRVKATNIHGSSLWSNVVSVQVTHVVTPTGTPPFGSPLPPTPTGTPPFHPPPPSPTHP